MQAEEFGRRIYREAGKRGWSRAEKKVVMGDGAEWIWNLAEQHFPGAMQIVDLYHARPHVWNWCAGCIPTTKGSRKRGGRSTRAACSTRGKSNSW